MGTPAAGGLLPGQFGKAANQFSGLVQNSPGQGYGAQVSPAFQNIAKQQVQTAYGPLGGQLMQGAQQGAQLGGQAANSAGAFGQSLYPQAQNLMGYGNQIAQMGFDPQSALYNRTLQQTQDQARAAQAARGIASSPYGAGLEDQATRNFNIDWQNQLLNRATQAGSAIQGLDTAAAGLGSSAFNLGSGASSLAQQAAQMPYQARQGLLTNAANARAGVGTQIQQANQPSQQVINDYLQFLGMGPAYQQASASAQQAGNQLPLGIGQMGLAGIGK